MRNCLNNRIVPFILAILLFTGTSAHGEFKDKTWLIIKFNEYDLAINNGDGYSKSTNESGALAWAESYLLEAYLDMYEATLNISYIEKFIIHSNRIITNSDKMMRIADYKGRIRTGWNATKYSENRKPMIHVVNSGMILYPMTKFSLMVKKNKDLSKYSNFAEKLTKLAEDGVLEFESQWKYNTDTGEGTYWFEGDEPMRANLTAPMPINGPLALGRVIVKLYQITGNDSYLSKNIALALYFKRNLHQTNDGMYIWGYRLDMKKYPQIEDISHGAIDVDFAVQSSKISNIFTEEDLMKFSKTLIATKKNGNFSKFVDGSDNGRDKVDYSEASGRWLELSTVDCRVYKIVYDYMINMLQKNNKVHPSVMLGLAKLIKYQNKCR